MDKGLPQVSISQDLLQYLLASMLVYRDYRWLKTPPTRERGYTLLVLTSLLPKLQRGTELQEEEVPLLLTVDEVRVMKSGLSMMIDKLAQKTASRRLEREITRLKELKKLLDQHFHTTQD